MRMLWWNLTPKRTKLMSLLSISAYTEEPIAPMPWGRKYLITLYFDFVSSNLFSCSKVPSLIQQYCFSRFFACEVLNFVNVIGQIFFIDTFLDGEFSTYGMRVFEYSGLEFEDRPDPMAVVFPKVTKCTFHKYGPSGTVQLHDGLCVLPTNIINEKIYIFLWLWLVSLSVVTGAFLIYRIAVILGPQIRVALIAVKVSYSYKNHYLFCHNIPFKLVFCSISFHTNCYNTFREENQPNERK